MREIDWRLRAIVDRSNTNRKFTAALHGREISVPSMSKTPVKLSDEQISALEKAQLEGQKRVQGRINGRR